MDTFFFVICGTVKDSTQKYFGPYTKYSEAVLVSVDLLPELFSVYHITKPFYLRIEECIVESDQITPIHTKLIINY
jgi:hypothetical protein